MNEKSSFVTSSYNDGDQTLTIIVDGRFEFNLREQFRASYSALESKPAQYIVDLNKTVYIDSTGLGMLLLLRDFAGGRADSVKIIGTNETVKQILTTVKFQDLFIIE